MYLLLHRIKQLTIPFGKVTEVSSSNGFATCVTSKYPQVNGWILWPAKIHPLFNGDFHGPIGARPLITKG